MNRVAVFCRASAVAADSQTGSASGQPRSRHCWSFSFVATVLRQWHAGRHACQSRAPSPVGTDFAATSSLTHL